MNLAGSQTIIRRSTEQWWEFLQRFEHSSHRPGSVLHPEGLVLSTFTLWRRIYGSSCVVKRNAYFGLRGRANEARRTIPSNASILLQLEIHAMFCLLYTCSRSTGFRSQWS